MSKKKKNIDLPLKEQIKPIFKERFTQLLGEEEYQKFVDCITTPQRKSFRINTFKEKNPNELLKHLKEKGLEFTEVPWSKHAYFLEYDKEKRSDLGNLFEHFLGKVYVQEATSMTPPEVLEIPDLSTHPSPNSFKVLDMCASPGSKTTQLGSMMKNKGVLVANELDYKRLGPLKINLERSGFSNIIITNNDGNSIEGEEIFDRVLLDAPCSGSGVIRKSPKTIKRYNPKQLKAITQLQLKLLQRAFALLKKGGIVTYSTCSIDPEENELLVQEFLNNEPNAKLEPITLPGLILNNKVTEFNGIKIDKEITEKTIRIWPQDNDTNGFYLAKISKAK
jgi:NOL1/NOP2/sun family putative RNA methylase